MKPVAAKFPFSELEDNASKIKHALGEFFGDTMDAIFVHSVATELSPLLGVEKEYIVFALKPYCEGQELDNGWRVRLSYRLANFIGDLRSKRFINRWQSYSEGEWVAAMLVGVSPLEEDNVIKVNLHWLIKAGSSAGEIQNLVVSMPQAKRMAYFLGYSMRKTYDSRDPYSLKFLNATLQVSSGERLMIKNMELAHSQHKANSAIINRRCGDCPMKLRISCTDCALKHGPWTGEEQGTCEGSVNK